MGDAVDFRSIFWKSTPISLRRSDNDEFCHDLNVRVMLGTQRGGQAPKIFKMYISNESDPSFLYSLEVTEEVYGRLKEEEQLLVDFAGFADKLIWLLQQCSSSDSNETPQGKEDENNTPCLSSMTPKFRAVLQVAGTTAGTLRILERNAFKELPHLTLRTKAGTDSKVKEFLAFRLGEVMDQCKRLTEDVTAVRRAYEESQKQLQICSCSSEKASEEYEINVQRHKKACNDLQMQLEDSQSRCEVLSAQLSHESAASAAASERALKAESMAERLLSSKSEVEVELAECLNRLNEAEERAESAETGAAQVTQRCEGFKEALQHAERRIDDWRIRTGECEQRAAEAAAEISQLRRTAEVTAQESSQLRAKLEDRVVVIEALQLELTEAKACALAADKSQKELKQKLETAQTTLDSAEQKASTATAQVEELKTKLRSNEKMIAWLNKQLTTAQLQAGNTRDRRMPATAHHAPPAGLTTARWAQSAGAPYIEQVRCMLPIAEESTTSIGTKSTYSDEWIPRNRADVLCGGLDGVFDQTTKRGDTASPASVLPGRAVTQ